MWYVIRGMEHGVVSNSRIRCYWTISLVVLSSSKREGIDD